MTTKKLVVDCIDFRGMGAIADVGSPDAGPLVQTIVDTAGTATVTISGGKCVLALDNDNEVESAAIHSGDRDPWNAARLQRVRFRLKGPVAVASAVSSWYFGLVSNFNADLGASTQHIFLGTNDDDGELKLWAEDNVGVDINGQATGAFFDPTTEFDYVFDFVEATKSVAPPGSDEGRWSNVQIYAESLNALGGSQRIPKRRLLANTQIDLSLLASGAVGLNPVVMVKKASGTTTDTVTVELIEAEYEQEAA